MTSDGPVDYRFLLANERTFLAYVRTGLALQIAGLGALQFLTEARDVTRIGLGVALVLVGSYVAFAGYRRWRDNDRSIRAGVEMHAARVTAPVTVAVVALPLLAAVLIALS